ncbi:uncharacterized protein LOC100879380 isoform X10 [Megachile rotundata]|uniref:uncharacterized protein LOC100879380 isoform X10 n=1 Tax=Megachile rotundata TaxID=143995 RepID=UPI0006153CFF|nr:PREDICTED: uncharacterized protein LOC100879380 isoform X6 [Megachile rotundata]
MMSRRDRFFVVLALLCVAVGFTHAIYDPRELTTKPPKRREPVLPWYSSDKDDVDSSEERDLSRSPKWRIDSEEPAPRKPYIVETGTKNWTPWRKNRGSEIEQRTEIPEDQQIPTNFEQNRDYSLEYSQFEQQENQRVRPGSSSSQKQNERWNKQENSMGKDSQSKMKDDQEFYEGIPPDSTKPRKEEILFSSQQKSTVARYDPKMGVQCPDSDSTGQFVYPPDCKFFVNCWKGRAFVQPCAPGTHFNPETLECDFPHKVKCYGGEVADFPSADYLESSGKQEPLSTADNQGHLGYGRIPEPRCPLHLTGMLAHPADCTKFLQCAHGGTFIRDCAPGTVFNPAISVCDWPYNVKGCEDALKPKEETTTPFYPPEYEDYGYKKPRYNEEQPVKKIECPEYYTGLLPHPETCKKFLQCANGITYIMDCGPGTAFNPSISVCDWPYNVPGCSENKATTITPWSSHSPDSSSWQHTGVPSPGRPTHPMTTARPDTDWVSVRATQRPAWLTDTWTTAKPAGTDWDSLRPTWKPSWKPSTWTTATPPYSHNHHHHHPHHGNSDSSTRYDHRHHSYHDHDSWDQTSAANHPHTQWHHNHGTSDQSPNYNGHHHNHEHHHHHGPTYDSNRDTETQQPSPPFSQEPSQGVGGHSQGSWDSVYHHDHHHRRPYYQDGSGESDQQTPQVPFGEGPKDDQQAPQVPFEEGPKDDQQNPQLPFDIKGDYSPNTPGNLPANRRIGGDFTPNRQEYGRTNPGFSQSGSNPVIPPGQNIYVDSDYQISADRDSDVNLNRWNKTWMQPNSTGSRMQPGRWVQSQMGPGQPTQPSPNRQWDQEEPPFPTYYIPPVEPLDHSKKVSIPTPISGQVVRLRGGSGPHDGYVEVQGTNPGWGIVCDSRNRWTLKEAHVLCKQLGYTRGAEMAWQGRNNRNGIPTWIAANTVSCQGDEAKFQSCKFTHEQECRVERDAIGVRCALNRVAHCRKDELPYEGQCYHLADPDSGLNHAEALDYCEHRQSRLIDITSQAENDFISEWLVQMHPEVGAIMTSGVGFTTFNRTLWVWEDSSRAKFKFTKWWPGWTEDKKIPPFVGSRPLCLVMKRKFPCHERPDSICVADYFFWDTEDCATSSKGHSYICKRPYDDIGCIYGKGGQYAGNANVTASGKECLPWSDPKVSHPLTVNVVNRELREKLKTHNYCRNPNPTREPRPWCFTGPGAEREYCDIPSCGNVGSPKSLLTGKCKPKHFECLPGECIPSPWVCDGDEDCTNGADEKDCVSHMDLFQKYSKQKLEGYDVQKWLNTPLKTCALRCKEADFTCRSFSHKSAGNICLLSDSNIGMTGSLKPNKEFDYYEMTERSVNCEGMYVCQNRKCISQTKVCNGKNDCNDRSDESICTVENLDYAIRLAGSENNYEGRIEVKILGVWGQVCDDGFGMIDANVICKELGFVLGALEIRPGGFYGNLDPPTRFMVDQLRCRGNETSLRECDFDGWGVHNCQPEEAVGVICKTAVDSCQDGHWKCDKSPTCIPTAFICDEVVDCPDRSDESSEHCDAPFEIRLVNGSSPLEGRVEVRHHGIWGTVCDDDFSNATATVICRSLGYGGRAIAKKDGYFGPGEGPIWLDEVFCLGNETQLYRCDHNHWGQHNCNHDEDAGVICTPGDINDSEPYWKTVTDLPETNINDILPSDCGKRLKDFSEDDELILERVVRGSIAPKGSYPWQASIRVRGHSRSNHWCGAVILSPIHVLTAAHCLQGYNKGTYFVRAGDYNTEIDEGTEIEANIEDYYIHEDFRKGHRMNNDIALVLLKGLGIPLGRNIMPICLPPENAEYPPGLNCTISGFGSIQTGKSAHSKDLRYGWVPLLDQSVCRAEHIYGMGAISDGMVCAGYLDEGIDSCDGDSGGPLACYHNGAFTLYGITSWGQHCGEANKPGVYVRVSHYRPWIDRKIKESLSGR